MHNIFATRAASEGKMRRARGAKEQAAGRQHPLFHLYLFCEAASKDLCAHKSLGRSSGKSRRVPLFSVFIYAACKTWVFILGTRAQRGRGG